jgi:regulator of PEP synthase PpsR (kinase-PPPase family)
MVSETASLLVRSLARVFVDVRNEELRYLPFAAAEMRVDWVANTMAARSRVMSIVSVEVLTSMLREIVVSAKKSLLSLRRNKFAA